MKEIPQTPAIARAGQGAMAVARRELAEIAKHIDKPKNRILPEQYFVGVYWPYFSGQQVFPEEIYDEKLAEFYENWASIAGNIRQEVDIVDNSDYSKVLYTVPAIVPLDQINPMRVGAVSVAQIAARYEVDKKRAPLGASGRFSANMLTKLREIVQPSEYQKKATEMWAGIFKRYGVPFDKETGGVVSGASASASQPPASVGDDFEFEGELPT